MGGPRGRKEGEAMHGWTEVPSTNRVPYGMFPLMPGTFQTITKYTSSHNLQTSCELYTVFLGKSSITRPFFL